MWERVPHESERIQPKGEWVQDLRERGNATSWHRLERRLLNVIICTLKLRKFDTVTEIVQRNVCVSAYFPLARTSYIYYMGYCVEHINTVRRGLTALLILDRWAMRRPESRDGQR